MHVSSLFFLGKVAHKPFCILKLNHSVTLQGRNMSWTMWVGLLFSFFFGGGGGGVVVVGEGEGERERERERERFNKHFILYETYITFQYNKKYNLQP